VRESTDKFDFFSAVYNRFSTSSLRRKRGYARHVVPAVCIASGKGRCVEPS
jgi:hypothetical protein